MLDGTIVETLLGINYFRKLGDPSVKFDSFGCEFVPSIQAVMKTIAGMKWENVRLDNIGDITAYLAKAQLNGDWNKHVDEVKQEIVPYLLQQIRALPFDPEIIEAISIDARYDITNIAMTMIYARYARSEFYERMLQIYSAGHLPCGWRGKTGGGVFLVY